LIEGLVPSAMISSCLWMGFDKPSPRAVASSSRQGRR
jgi:hypothetical protein